MAETRVHAFLDFEKPIAELEGKIEELRHLSDDGEISIVDEVERLQTRVDRQLDQTYSKLSPWQKVQVARHPGRPHCLDYVRGLITEFTPLAGDRGYAEDNAIIGGLGRFEGQSVVVIGQEKGHDTESRVKHNFGMARPEGYRKAVRLMEMADRFGIPVITLIDTPGAYPGKGAEERGQSEAIARSTEMCLKLGAPLIAVVIGEGGSGGAVAFATGDRVIMLEHSIYSVITPEGCASILWKNAEKMKEAAAALRLTAQDLKGLGVIDVVVKEPLGGAQRDRKAAIEGVREAIRKELADLEGMSAEAIRTSRRTKFLDMGSKGLG